MPQRKVYETIGNLEGNFDQAYGGIFTTAGDLVKDGQYTEIDNEAAYNAAFSDNTPETYNSWSNIKLYKDDKGFSLVVCKRKNGEEVSYISSPRHRGFISKQIANDGSSNVERFVISAKESGVPNSCSEAMINGGDLLDDYDNIKVQLTGRLQELREDEARNNVLKLKVLFTKDGDVLTASSSNEEALCQLRGDLAILGIASEFSTVYGQDFKLTVKDDNVGKLKELYAAHEVYQTDFVAASGSAVVAVPEKSLLLDDELQPVRGRVINAISGVVEPIGKTVGALRNVAVNTTKSTVLGVKELVGGIDSQHSNGLIEAAAMTVAAYNFPAAMSAMGGILTASSAVMPWMLPVALVVGHSVIKHYNNDKAEGEGFNFKDVNMKKAAVMTALAVVTAASFAFAGISPLMVTSAIASVIAGNEMKWSNKVAADRATPPSAGKAP